MPYRLKTALSTFFRKISFLCSPTSTNFVYFLDILLSGLFDNFPVFVVNKHKKYMQILIFYNFYEGNQNFCMYNMYMRNVTKIHTLTGTRKWNFTCTGSILLQTIFLPYLVTEYMGLGLNMSKKVQPSFSRSIK